LKLEKEIAELEKEMERLDTEMSQEGLTADWLRLQEMSQACSRIQDRIDECFAEWETVEAEMAVTRTE
jgi:septation ring formation regulator EzrA